MIGERREAKGARYIRENQTRGFGIRNSGFELLPFGVMKLEQYQYFNVEFHNPNLKFTTDDIQ